MLDRLVQSLAGAFAFAGVAWSQGGRDAVVVRAAPGMTAQSDAMFRVASITKVVMGRVLERVMAAHNIAFPYALDVRGLMDLPPNPHAPISQKVTFQALASHTAGFADLMVPTDRSLTAFLRETPTAWDAPAAQRFAYSNLSYVVLAAALEASTGQRLDQLAAPVLRDLGITGGLNWAGVSAVDRARALPTYRRDGAQFVAQIDADVPDTGLMQADGRVFDLAGYAPGWNPAVFAPQGGLRTDLSGMLTLAKSLGQPVPLWRQSDAPGEYADGLFQDYGAGVQILPDPPFYPRPLVGHFGNAYGFTGGVWYDAGADLAFAYALNGRAMGDEADAITPAEQQIFAAIAALRG